MQFNRINPPAELKNLVECYWIAVDSNTTPRIQKIIPDGYPEIVFHFADHYRIKLTSQWEQQQDTLIAGQISKYFFLENSGASNILGIKLKPYALTHLFEVDMNSLKDQVIGLSYFRDKTLEAMNNEIRAMHNHTTRIDFINQHLLSISLSDEAEMPIQKVIDRIFLSNGMLSIASVCEQCDIHERQLERYFKKWIGLSPKFFSRVVRFSYIFQVAQKKKLSWSEVGLESGFYDQPHFIKDFKAFSGEDPSQYFFDEPNLANFFMKKV